MVVLSSTHSSIGRDEDASPSPGPREGLRGCCLESSIYCNKGETVVCDSHLRNLKSRDLAEVFCGIRQSRENMMGKTTFPPMVGQR